MLIKITKKNLIMSTAGWLIVCKSMFSVLQAAKSSNWQMVPIEVGFPVAGNIASGDGRNTGSVNLYVGSEGITPPYRALPGYIAELSWNGSDWDVVIIDTFTKSTGWELSIGKGRNDGISRLYATDWTSGQLYEYTYSTTTLKWSKEIIATLNGPSLLTVGEGRNDGINRIYIFNIINMTTVQYLELTYTSSSWVTVDLKWRSNFAPSLTSSLEQNENSRYSELVIADGRNDNVKRVYRSNVNGGIEETWNGSSWDETRIGSNCQGFVFGDVKGEGVKSLYSGSNFVAGYKWNGSEWVNTDPKVELEDMLPTLPTTQTYFGSVIGIWDARNDGVKRIYTQLSCKKSYLFELTWKNGQWEKNLYDLIEHENIDDFSHLNIICADTKSDGISRLYTTGSGLYEFRYVPPFNTNQVEQDKLVPVNNYFNPLTGGSTSISYKITSGGKVELKIYTINGKLVKTLLDRNVPDAMEGNIGWNGKDDNDNIVGSGIYLIHLKAPGTSVTKKICVVK